MESDIRYLVNQGKIFFKNQAYKKAENIFLKVVSSQHEFADVYNMLGIIHHQAGEFSKAITNFEKAIKINPYYTEALLNLSVLYNDLGEYKQARQLIQRSKKIAQTSRDKIDVFVRSKLANKHAETGDLYRGVGLYAAAIDEYQKALAHASQFHDIRNKLGICLREEGRKQDALKEFHRIAKERPSYVDARIQLGVTYYSLGKKSDALQVWKELAKSHPGHELVRMYLRLSQTSPLREKNLPLVQPAKAKSFNVRGKQSKLRHKKRG